MISDRGLALIREFEGLRLAAYPDPASGGAPWTIGYGHTAGVKPGDTCTPEQAEIWLRQDADTAARVVLRHVVPMLTQAQLDALASFVFNIGPGVPGQKDGFVYLKSGRPSTLLRKINAQDWAGAAAEFKKWNLGGGRPMAGLTRRRAAEAALFTESPPLKENDMGILSNLGALAGPAGMLAGTLIEAFAPLAREKVERELARHTDNPEVVKQVTDGVIAAAKTVTGKDDAFDAVAAAKADPTAVAKVETDTLDTLDRLAPLLDKLAAWDREAWAAETASMDAAAQRAANDPNDQDVFLTRSIVSMMVGLLALIGILIGVLAYFKVDAQVLIGLFVTLAGGVAAKFGTRYDHRYGSSRNSNAKDVVIGELSRRKA